MSVRLVVDACAVVVFVRRSELSRRKASARFAACLGVSPGLKSRTRPITPAG